MPRGRTWNDEELHDAVRCSSTYFDVCQRLGIRAGGGTYRTLERHIARLALDASHLAEHRRHARRRRTWSDGDLAEAVRTSSSVTDVLRQLGYEPNGGNHRFIKHHIARLAADTAHFTGRSWAKGRRFPGRRQLPLRDLLVERSPQKSSAKLRKRLIKAGLKSRQCEECGRTTWEGAPLPLELHHVNGEPSDNRIENLRILCPNCHAVAERLPNGSTPA